MKRALVCGAGGFVGGHPSTELRAGLVKKLKREGYWVRGVDIKEHEFAPTQVNEFWLLGRYDFLGQYLSHYWSILWRRV